MVWDSNQVRFFPIWIPDFSIIIIITNTVLFPSPPVPSHKPNTPISSVQFSRSVVSQSLRPHELQHARLPCPSPAPRVHPNSHPSSWGCHLALSSSVVPFSSCPQSLPASESFPDEISPGYSLEGMMLKLKLQYFGHLMQRADSLENTPIPAAFLYSNLFIPLIYSFILASATLSFFRNMYLFVYLAELGFSWGMQDL